MDRTQSPFTDADEVFRAEASSRLECREELIAGSLAALGARGCAPDPYFDRLCLDEAIVNAMLHGNQSDPAKKVRLRVFVREDRWGVEVADEGPGFDWKAAANRLQEANAAFASSGRGLGLIMASGAEVFFLDGGRRVLITRRRAGTEGAP